MSPKGVNERKDEIDINTNRSQEPIKKSQESLFPPISLKNLSNINNLDRDE